MIKSLRIILWDEEVGRLAWDEHRGLSYFVYNPEFVRKGLNIFPLAAPVSESAGLLPIWGETARIYQRLPAFVADSLPDAWGNQLFELWRNQQKLSNSEINPLDKLSFIGRRGMGALEFVPEAGGRGGPEKIDVKSLANLAERIFTEKENVRILPEESISMQSLLTVGTSAGGRQPKAIIAINRTTGEIRSGQIPGLKGFDYCILKFGNSESCSAEIEMTYYRLATQAGINMMPSELYEVEGNNHFLTRRFDREGKRKIHTQTLAAIDPDADSYERLVSVCRKLHLPEADCQEVFRRMVFNILSNNTDDHNKNFSFVMSEDGSWRLAPAYDVTYIVDRGGYLPNKEHCLYIRAKLRDITRDDAIAFARNNGIRRPDSIIRDIAASLRQFRRVAAETGVSESWIGRIEAAIVGHLTAWGECQARDATTAVSVEITGHVVRNIRIEQAYKGNYHLVANIDGTDRKYVLGKDKEDFEYIERTGPANLTADYLRALVEKYLV